MKLFFQSLSDWFFEQADARTAALLRVSFFALYAAVLLDFYPVMPLLFGHRGMMGTMEPVLHRLSGFRYFLFKHDSPLELQLWFWISMVVTLAAMMGFLTRFTAVLSFLSMALFRERDPYMTFGADLVMNCVGLWLLFLNSGQAWSVDSWLRRRKKRFAGSLVVEGWPLKAVQIQIALVYLVTGLKKLQTPPWQQGSAVYYSIWVGNVLKGHPPSWILSHHVILAAMNYGTLFIEIVAPFLLFVRSTRFWAMLAFFGMHTGIDLFMSIRFFSVSMYVGYSAFLRRSDWEALRLRAGNWKFLPPNRKAISQARTAASSAEIHPGASQGTELPAGDGASRLQSRANAFNE